MSAALRPGLALALLPLAFGLSGCLTPHAKVHVSQAVKEARAHHDVAQAAACPQAPLATASPVQASFAFDDATLDATSSPALAAAAQWLACRSTPVAITPDADGHGTPAEQDALARKRAGVVASYLTGHGVAQERIRILPRGQAAPGGEIFVISAEGRRW
jgi:outer membrane protein OmpA-like peptidoglycan-associated protein